MYNELEVEMESRPWDESLRSSSWDEFQSMLNDDESAELLRVGLSAPQQLYLHRPHDRAEDVFNPRTVKLRPILQGMLADLAAKESNRYRNQDQLHGARVTFDAWLQSLNVEERRGVDELGLSKLEHLQYVRPKQMRDCHLRMIPNRLV